MAETTERSGDRARLNSARAEVRRPGDLGVGQTRERGRGLALSSGQVGDHCLIASRPVTRRLPSYTGTGLVNLVAEIENRLSGTALTGGLDDPIPRTDGYVLVLFDGLGAGQLHHRFAGPLMADHAMTLTAGFPTTTTTSLATLVTGLAPAAHGIIGHILHLPPTAELVNTLKWIGPDGRPVAHDYQSVLPAPNLWERLARAGIEPITVQPGSFMGSPLSQVLYRGCRFEPAWSTEELARVTADVAGPGRLVMTYYPNVDVAAHVSGQHSEAYRKALSGATRLWESLRMMLAPESPCWPPPTTGTSTTRRQASS